MLKTTSTLAFMKPLMAICAATLLSACTAPEGMRYKMTANSPATSSLGEAYSQLFDEMWQDTKEVVAMDRYRHGVRPAVIQIPPQDVAAAEPMAQDVAFDHYEQLYFKVYKVEVVDQSGQTASTNYDEHLPVTASDAVHSWAGRLRPTGGPNKLQVIIRDARMAPEGGSELATSDRRYDVNLTVEMRISDRSGNVLASVTSSAAQSALVAGMDNYDRRKASLNAMLSKLIDTTNRELETKLALNFSPYLVHQKPA